MTTTKELRETLNTVEPAFPGLEVDAILHRAHRIRRRQRATGVALGVFAVATGVVVAPHVLGDHHSGPGAMDAAMPPHHADARAAKDWARVDATAAGLLSARVRPRTGALAKIGATSSPLPVLGSNVWIRSATSESRPYFCWGAQPPAADGCNELDRDADGVASWAVFDGRDKRMAVVVVDGVIQSPIAVQGDSPLDVQVADLGSGYSALVATLTPGKDDVTAVLAAWGDQNTLSARWAATIPAKGTMKGTLAEPLSWPSLSARVALPDAGRSVWVQEREGESAPRVCNALASGFTAPTCAPLVGTADGVRHAFTVTAPGGDRTVTAVVTSEPVIVVSATVDGAYNDVTFRDLGFDYKLIFSTVSGGGVVSRHLTLRGLDPSGRERMHFEYGG